MKIRTTRGVVGVIARITGRTLDKPVPYLAIGYLYFDKLSAYRNSLGPNAGKIFGDIINFNNIQPVLQISEVVR